MDHETDRNLVAAAANTNQPQQKTQPRSILTEEDYTDTLTHIVTRDYFPSIHSLRRDHAILEARSRGDIASAVTARRQFRKEETEREREWEENMQEETEAVTGTTALTHHHGNRAMNVRKRPRPLKHESVTGFHARATSEDNAEFEMNQEQEQRDLEAKMAVVYSASANKKGRLMIESALSNQHVEGDGHDNNYNHDSLLSDNLGLASDKFNTTPSGIRITDGKESNSTQEIIKNGLFFEPQHPKQKVSASNSDHLLMPPPPARDPNSTSSSIIPLRQSEDQPPTKDAREHSSPSKQLYELVEYIPKSTEPDINPPATRFPYQNESRLLPHSNRNSIDIHRSNSHSSDTSASEFTDLDASPRSLQRERTAYQKAKVRENEAFVAMTPLIRPGGSDGGSNGEAGAGVEPIMTWGNVASTPLVLGGGSSADGYNNSAEWEPSPLLAIDTGDSDVADKPAFDVVDESSREVLAQNAEKMLMDRARKYSAAKSSEKIRRAYTPQSKYGQASPLDRSASLTPAGRALLQASKRDPSPSIFQPSNGSRTMNARSKDSFGSALRTAYTPTPKRGLEGSKRRNSSTPAMLRAAAAAAAGATPRIDKSGHRG